MLRQALTTSSRAVSSPARAAAIASQTQFLRTPPRAARAPFVLAQRAATPPRIARWYSDEAKPTDKEGEAKTEASEAAEAKKPETEAPPKDSKEALMLDIETKTKEILEWKDRYLRSVADFRNLQDRQAREMKAARDFAIQKFAKDLVDSVDNLDRALTTVPQDKLKSAGTGAESNAAAPEQEGDHTKPEHLKDLVNLYEGIKMTETILLQTLQKHGLERFDPDGQIFNPNEHEATFMAPQPDKEHNTVFHTQQKGFKLHGRVLRPAKVGVVRNK